MHAFLLVEKKEETSTKDENSAEVSVLVCCGVFSSQPLPQSKSSLAADYFPLTIFLVTGCAKTMMLTKVSITPKHSNQTSRLAWFITRLKIR